MLPDNRLEPIAHIDPGFIEAINDSRKMFIAADEILRFYSTHEKAVSSGALRTISLARTHLETSCMYAVKSLCLLGEITEGSPKE